MVLPTLWCAAFGAQQSKGEPGTLEYQVKILSKAKAKGKMERLKAKLNDTDKFVKDALDLTTANLDNQKLLLNRCESCTDVGRVVGGAHIMPDNPPPPGYIQAITSFKPVQVTSSTPPRLVRCGNILMLPASDWSIMRISHLHALRNAARSRAQWRRKASHVHKSPAGPVMYWGVNDRKKLKS
eukprot:3528335-Pyramimonas_sp.AAC.3